jgi:FtsH-binding integral membrane protein
MLFDTASNIKRAKICIKIVAGMTVFAGMAIGLILAHAGGHGPVDIPLDIVFTAFGGFFSSPVAYIHVLAARKLEQQDRASFIYVYMWCAVMIAVGVFGLFGLMISIDDNDIGLISLALFFIVPGIIAVYVLLVKRAKRTTAYSP